MQIRKKMAGIVLLFVVILPFSAADAKASGVGYGDSKSYGVMLSAAYIERSLTTVEDGKPVAVVAVSTSEDTIVQVVDLNNSKLLRAIHLETGGGSTGYLYYGTVADNGVVYMGIGPHLVSYDPQTHAAKILAKGPTTKSGNLQGLCYAAESNCIYGASGNYARIYKYDITNQTMSTIATLSDCTTTSDAEVMDGYIYAVGKASDATTGTQIWKISITNPTGDVTKLSLPAGVDVMTAGTYLHAGGKYLICRMTSSAGTYAYAYDTVKNQWTDTKFAFDTSGMTDMDSENRFWYLNGGCFHSIDMDDLTITDYPKFKYSTHLRGNGKFVRLDDQTTYPGESFVTAQYNGSLWIFNPTKQSSTKLEVTLQGGALEHRVSRIADDGRIYVYGFKASKGAALNPVTGAVEYFSCGQGEGITSAGDKVYIGYYANAYVMELDATKPFSQSSSDRKNLLKLEAYDQDRPFGMDVAGDYLLIGTLPKAGVLGGALTVMDRNTYTYTVYDDAVLGIDNQAILTVTHKGNMVYFGTTISGGGSTTPATNVAQVVAFDLESRRVVKKTELVIPNLNVNIGAVKGLCIGPDGNLYGSAKSIDFVMNPDTLELKQYHVYGDSFDVNNGYGTQIWHETHMQFDAESGYLFRGGAIVDPITLEIIAEAPGLGQFAGIDEDYAYFVSDTTEVFAVELIRDSLVQLTDESGESITDGISAGEQSITCTIETTENLTGCVLLLALKKSGKLLSLNIVPRSQMTGAQGALNWSDTLSIDSASEVLEVYLWGDWTSLSALSPVISIPVNQ